MKNFRTIILLLLPFAFFACKKEKKVNAEFEWFANGNVFHYDYYTAAGIQKNYISVAIADNALLQNLRDAVSPPQINLQNIYGKYVVKDDGLYTTAPIDCSTGGIYVAYFNYLYAPNDPALGQQIPVYQCQSKVKYYLDILATNQTITVPQGTFTTYVMQYQNGDKAYWDPNNGLIKYELYDQNGNLGGTLKLNGITSD
jgi:hypothetical protein